MVTVAGKGERRREKKRGHADRAPASWRKRTALSILLLGKMRDLAGGKKRSWDPA